MEGSGRTTAPSTPKNISDRSSHETTKVSKEDSKLLKYALGFVTLGFLIMLGAFVGSVLFTLRVMRDQRDMAITPIQGKSGEPEFADIERINEIPLSHIDQTQSLYLQWGEPNTPEEVQYFFDISAATRSPSQNKTTLMLSAGHQLHITTDKAVLVDAIGEELGVVDFKKRKEMIMNHSPSLLIEEQEKEHHPRALDILQNPKNKYLLKGKALLQKYGRYPTNVKRGAPEDAFDAYCRYGCGEMAVRFPYYYRPFFGYGFPLVGTESQFPQGYGGYPMASVMMQQGLATPQMQSPQMMGMPPM